MTIIRPINLDHTMEVNTADPDHGQHKMQSLADKDPVC